MTADDINRTLGRLEGKIDAFIKQMEVQDNRATDLETRVRSVENKQYWMSGAGGILGAIAGALGLHVKW
jgi:hypothetical protein